MYRRLTFALLAASLAACSHAAAVLPASSTPAFQPSAIHGAAPALSVKLTGANLRFATGRQATGFRFGGLVPQGVKVSVLGGSGSYSYTLSSANSAVVDVKPGKTAGGFVVTPKAEVAKIALNATATPAGGGKTLKATLSLEVAPLIYVANYPGETGMVLGVYVPWNSKAIARFGATAPNALTVDRKGNVWLANGTTVEEYSAGLAKHVRTISGFSKASAVAVDAAGNVYCVDGYTVVEYGPSGSTPKRTLGPSQGITSALSVAVDALDDLYVADFYTGIWVFGPGTTTKPLRKLTAGVGNPRIVVVAGNDVYIANNAPNTTIPRYAVGATAPNGTFGKTSGVPGPSSLAVDGKGDVYASIDTLAAGVIEYTPSSVASPARTLNLTGGGNPTGLATDSLGNLYVANGIDYVDVFAPGTGTAPSYNIGGPSGDIFSPSAVAVWP